MAQAISIVVRDIWLRGGPRRWSSSFPLDQFSGAIASDRILIVFRWPSSLSYLKVAIRTGPGPAPRTTGDVGPAGGEPEFTSNAEELLKSYGIKTIPSDESRLVALLDRGARVLIDLEVDTDDPKLKRDAQESDGESLTREIAYLAAGRVPGAGNSAPPRYESGTISVVLTPVGRMPRDDGYVGIDLGNTNSTIVRVEAGRSRIRDVQLIEVGPEGRRGETIPSALRIVQFEPARNPRWFDQAGCVIGSAALDPNASSYGWLVLGAKRLLTGPDHAPPECGWISGRRVAIERELPAELLLGGLFRGVHYARAMVPRRIAVTCPTTFSRREIQRLKHAVVQGWRRSLEATARDFDPAQLTNPDIPQLMLDEAAAAAFFFIYRDLVDAPGGLYALRYLYPHGLNLLVYDCGGGTTDIALVRAQVESDPEEEASRVARLSIRVLGRTGQHSFGGDNITVAAFRIIKAGIACRINRRGLADFRMPGASALAEFIDRFRAEIEFNVPTAFASENLALEEQRLRMKATLELWEVAERLKIALGSADTAAGAAPAPMPALAQLISKHHGMAIAQAEAALGDLRLGRAELDALIAEALDRSIAMANRMIASRIEDGEVHRVHLVGNASRYPAVPESIRKKLGVRFLTDRLRVEEADRKTAVAKGAALALAIRASYVGTYVEFDTEHIDRLPYDITYDDLTIGGPRVLFHEGRRYDDLHRLTIPLPAPRRKPLQELARRVILSRRWPGEESATPFLLFDFVKPIQGPLRVWYDCDRNGFFMQDSVDPPAEVPGVELDTSSFRSPIESGDL